MRAAVLSLLAEQPRNGYQIIQAIEERSGGSWRVSPGAVYPALQQLADEGLIVGKEENGRKTFTLTDAGRAYVAGHAEELAAPWQERARPDLGEGVGELFKQSAQLGGALMQVAYAGSADHVAQATQIVTETRRRLYNILADQDDNAVEDE